MWRHKIVVGLAIVLSVAASYRVFSGQQSLYTAAVGIGPSESSVLAATISGNAPSQASAAELGRLLTDSHFAELVAKRAGGVSADQVTNMASVDPNSTAGIVIVNVKDMSAERAMRVAEALAAELIASDTTARTRVTDGLRATLQKYIDQRRDEAAKLDALRVKLQGALTPQQDVDTQRALSSYGYLAQRMDDLNLATVQGPSIEVWQQPRITEANTPNLISFLLVGTLVGFVVGGIGAVGLDHAKHDVDTADEFGTVLQAPVWAVIPRASKKAGSDNLAAERWRLLNAKLAREVNENHRQTLLMVPITEDSGSDVVLSSLAKGLSGTGHSVILICADPTSSHALQQRLGIGEQAKGLAEVLRGVLPLNEAVSATAVPNLWVVPTGDAGSEVSGFIESAAFRSLLSELTRRAEIILVATNSLDQSVDSVVATEHVDGVVLVGALGKTARKAVERSHDLMTDAGADVLGVVLYESPIAGEPSNA